MASLADHIEAYIKQQLQRTPNHILVLSRSELADTFSCVPSQINYVLTTRFTQDRGYVIESRRGGGGYIRVVKTLPGHGSDILEIIGRIGGQIAAKQADNVLLTLVDHGSLNGRQAQLIKAVLQQEIAASDLDSNCLRASLLRAMLVVHLQEPVSQQRR